jgi:hypothetical protein
MSTVGTVSVVLILLVNVLTNTVTSFDGVKDSALGLAEDCCCVTIDCSENIFIHAKMFFEVYFTNLLGMWLMFDWLLLFLQDRLSLNL